MATPAQITANQHNATHSTGPKTPEGKAAAARNATKHGLSGAFTVLPHEDQDEFDVLLASLRDDLPNFKPMVESLWRTMDAGGFSPILREHILRFNGGLFETTEALPLNRKQFDILCLAASAESKMWSLQFSAS